MGQGRCGMGRDANRRARPSSRMGSLNRGNVSDPIAPMMSAIVDWTSLVGATFQALPVCRVTYQ